MKTLFNFALAAALAVSMSGCIVLGDHDHHDSDSSWRAEQEHNREMISQLSLGTTRSQILELMGAPAFSEAFAMGQDHYRVLSYRTQHRHSDGETSPDETTPLIFKNDRLVGWGEAELRRLHVQ